MNVSYETVRDRLTPEARELFQDMAEVHLAAEGDRRFFYTKSFGGSQLRFQGSPQWMKENPDSGTPLDLEGYSLLRIETHGTHGSKQYQVPGEAIYFYRWLREQEASPVEQVEADVLRFVEGEGFAVRHPGATRHIGEALDLLRSEDATSDQVASEIGGHLRGAIFDVAAEITGGQGDPEQPIPTLTASIVTAETSERERGVLTSLVGLADSVLRLDQRLTHTRDEAGKGLPRRGWDEVRRAVSRACLSAPNSIARFTSDHDPVGRAHNACRLCAR